MTIDDLKQGKCELIILLRRGGKRKRLTGEVIENKNGRKHFYARCSPLHSYGPGTRVIRVLKKIKKE